MSSLDKQENIFDQGSLSEAVEVYVPIYSEGSRGLQGVFETYRPDAIFLAVREARAVVFIGAVGGGLLLSFDRRHRRRNSR
jgi:hypothetical protein